MTMHIYLILLLCCILAGSEPHVQPISTISIVGERHSGTTFMYKLLETNIDMTSVRINENNLCGCWKHMFQSPLVNTCGSIHQTLVIVMLRNPYDWALSMHENCWCGHPHSREWIAEQEFSDFIASPFPPDKYSFIQWLNYTPAFKNVMHLRACKTLSYLNISNWAPQVEFVRHEDVIVPSLSLPWLQSIADKYMLKLSPSLQKGSEGKSLLKPVIQYKAEGTKFDPEAAKKKSVWFNPDLMNQDPKRKSDMDLVVKNLVEKVEQLSGYRDAQGKDIKGLSEGSLVSKELKEGLAHRLFEEICAR